METLSQLFGGVNRVKMMRLFLFNPEMTFDAAMIANRSKISSKEAMKEAGSLERISLTKKKVFYKGNGKRKAWGWSLNDGFPYLKELRRLLTDTVLLKNEEILTRISRVGRIKLLILSGVFLQSGDSRLDLLIVGDAIKKGALENVIAHMESEIGKELSYSYFETSDFKYRMGVYDRLVRDILDFPHLTLLDKIGFEPNPEPLP